MRLVIVLILVLAGTVSSASDGYIKVDDEMGQGFFRCRQNECYMITAAHVVKNLTTDSEATIITKDKSAFGFRIVDKYSDDIAILHVINNSMMCTGLKWSDGSSLRKILNENSSDAEIRRVYENGSFIRIPVEIVGVDSTKMLKIQTRNSKDSFAQGLSGSPIYIGDDVVGILTEVKDNVGVVVRQDYLHNLLRTFFTDENQNVQAEPTISRSYSNNKQPSILVQDPKNSDRFITKAAQNIRENLKKNNMLAGTSGVAKYEVRWSPDTRLLREGPDGMGEFTYVIKMIGEVVDAKTGKVVQPVSAEEQIKGRGGDAPRLIDSLTKTVGENIAQQLYMTY